jgi:hypothetical protein
MIRRIQRSLPWFGAVAAVLLLALPVQADDIEPEPYVEEEVVEPEPEPVVEVEEEVEPEVAEESDRNIEKFFDLVLVRPLYVARLVVGLPFFVFYPLTISSGYDEDVIALLWTEPYEATFHRPLGESPDDY